MKSVSCLIALCAAVLATPLAAKGETLVVDYVVEEWVETLPVGASRFVSPQQERAEREALAAFGPFRVTDNRTAALVGIIDRASPAAFNAMLAAYPEIEVLDFVEAPGTHDDVANMALGRAIRARGMATQVNKGGSVRSGAVELFLSGANRSIDSDSEFAVHGWLDDYGRGAQDYPAGAPEHRRYLEYYVEMGMDAQAAAAFYDMTNSVPYESARWLSGPEMRGWMGLDNAPETVSEADEPVVAEVENVSALPRLAYLDLSMTLP